MNEADNEPLENRPDRRITQKDIAIALNVSHVTVSLALRNHPRISEAMRKRVQETAVDMGYNPDPMLSALSNYRLTGKKRPLQAALAWVNPWKEPGKLREYLEFDLYWQGAFQTANQLGFRLEEFRIAELPPRRLNDIFKARNIRGLVLAPLRDPEFNWCGFPWKDYAIIRLGRTIPFPEAHFITGAQTTNAMLAFDQIRKKGYERIGYVCEFFRSRISGVGFSWAQRGLPPKDQLPLLVLNENDNNTMQLERLDQWIRSEKPDAIFTDIGKLPLMLEHLGYRVPSDIGLATASIHDTPIDAGIDQNPEEIGCAAIRALVALVNTNQFGIPSIRNEILIEGHWQDGSMLPDRFPKKKDQ
ncbi:LacI family DNA-binding transcriptional regulator [Pontiellaceae bacterium B12219]|nr:LacI family DNA-binding transcriptional regulator [Pontiellaceae bacterium B12219]